MLNPLSGGREEDAAPRRIREGPSVAGAKLAAMSTQYYTASSIDGFIADADNSLSWLFQFSEPSGMEDEYPRFIAQVGAMAMGSTTYEWIAQHTGFLNDASKWEYEVPTWVFSSRELPRVDGPDIRFVSGDVAPVHEEMLEVAEGRNIWLVGGGDLVGQFHDQGLLDEVIIGMASVTLGSGAPLLPRRIVTPPLQLLGATAYGADFVTLRYAVRKASET
jgi:dihydrofolate reductase